MAEARRKRSKEGTKVKEAGVKEVKQGRPTKSASKEKEKRTRTPLWSASVGRVKGVQAIHSAGACPLSILL